MKIIGWSLLFTIFVLQLSAQVDEVGTQKFEMLIGGNVLKIPYYSNFPLETSSATIRKLVITVHGTNRDADAYFDHMEEAASLRPDESGSTLIVAPQFLIEEDIDAFSLDVEHLYWSNGGWRIGSNSQSSNFNPRPERVSSFAVLDSLILRVADVFPNLESVIFAGHSAGGQVSNRYSGTSPVENILCSQYQVNTRFIVANPSSYAYMDNRRRVSGTTDQFEVPDAGDCPAYNEWGYGLDELFTYPALAGLDSILARTGRREIIYLLGQLDNDPNSSSLDKSCEANLQGAHRLERGSIYFNYVKQFFGENQSPFQQLDTVPFAGHSDQVMYTSDIGLFYLFESEPRSTCDQVTNIRSEKVALPIRIYPNPASDWLHVSGPAEEAEISLFSMDGKLLFQAHRQSTSPFRLDISNLPEGPFLLEYRTRDAVSRIMILKTGD